MKTSLSDNALKSFIIFERKFSISSSLYFSVEDFFNKTSEKCDKYSAIPVSF